MLATTMTRVLLDLLFESVEGLSPLEVQRELRKQYKDDVVVQKLSNIYSTQTSFGRIELKNNRWQLTEVGRKEYSTYALKENPLAT